MHLSPRLVRVFSRLRLNYLSRMTIWPARRLKYILVAAAMLLTGVAARGQSGPLITLQPQPQTIEIGQSTSFTVTATGSGSLSYQWQVYSASSGVWANVSAGDFYYSNVTAATLRIRSGGGLPGANARLNGNSYRCVVSDSVSSVISDPALLTVNIPPIVFEFQPADQVSNDGSATGFGVLVTATEPVTYQWQRLPVGSSTWENLVDGPGYHYSNDRLLTVYNTVLGMSGDQFRCVVSDPGSMVISAAATLTVVPDIAPLITLQPQSQTVIENSNPSFTVAANGAIPFTYLWQVSVSGTWSNLANADGYGGTTTATLTLANVNYSRNGNSYRCLVSNPVGTTPSDPAVLTINPTAPVFTGHSPTRVVLSPGQDSTLSVTSTGVGTLGYQWFRSGRPIDGATNSSLALTNVGAADAGYYNVRVTDTRGTRRSPTIFVLVAPATTHVVSWGDNSYGQTNTPAGLTTAVAVAANNNTSLALRADGTVIGWGEIPYGQTVPANLADVVALAVGTFHSLALRADGTVVTWGETSNGLGTPPFGLTEVVAIRAGFEYSMALKADGTVVAWGRMSDTYYQLAPPVGLTGVVAISGTGTTSYALKADGTVVAWGFNSDGQANVPPGLNNVVGIASGSGHALALNADGTVVAWGSNLFGQASVPAGLVSVTSIAANNVVSFALKADGTLVEWGIDGSSQFNIPQSRIPGGLNGVLAVDTGYAHALALCGGPWVAPSITNQTGSRTIHPGSPTSFFVTAGGSAPFTYQWQYFVGGVWINNIDLTDYAGMTTPTLTIASAQLWMNGTQHRCVVTNVAGSATSVPTTLAVTTSAAEQDFNGDGKADILWQNASTGDRGFWLMNGTGYASWVDMGYVTTDWRGAATADFNGDGKPDILWENTVSGVRGFWLMNGTAYASWVNMGYVSNDWRIAAAADFNGDGKADILWENTVTGDHGFWLMDGTAFSSWVDMGAVSTDWRFVAAADFNGDGKTDILMENTATGDRGFWLMNGTAFASWVDMGYVSADWHIAAAADFNGDGKPDILWENTVTGDRGFWLMNGTAYSSWVDLGYFSPDWHIAP